MNQASRLAQPNLVRSSAVHQKLRHTGADVVVTGHLGHGHPVHPLILYRLQSDSIDEANFGAAEQNEMIGRHGRGRRQGHASPVIDVAVGQEAGFGSPAGGELPNDGRRAGTVDIAVVQSSFGLDREVVAANEQIGEGDGSRKLDEGPTLGREGRRKRRESASGRWR